MGGKPENGRLLPVNVYSFVLRTHMLCFCEVCLMTPLYVKEEIYKWDNMSQ